MEHENAAVVVGGLRGNHRIEDRQVIGCQHFVEVFLVDQLVLEESGQNLAILFQEAGIHFANAVEKQNAGPRLRRLD